MLTLLAVERLEEPRRAFLATIGRLKGKKLISEHEYETILSGTTAQDILQTIKGCQALAPRPDDTGLKRVWSGIIDRLARFDGPLTTLSNVHEIGCGTWGAMKIVIKVVVHYALVVLA
jgi:hypothetical protein